MKTHKNRAKGKSTRAKTTLTTKNNSGREQGRAKDDGRSIGKSLAKGKRGGAGVGARKDPDGAGSLAAAATPEIANAKRLRERLMSTQADFVKTEVQTAMTFATVALDADNPEKRDRNRQNARKGYDTALRFAQEPEVGKDLHEGYRQELTKLEGLLRKLGEKV